MKLNRLGYFKVYVHLYMFFLGHKTDRRTVKRKTTLKPIQIFSDGGSGGR